MSIEPNRRVFVTRCKAVPHQTKYELHLSTLPFWRRWLVQLTRYRHGKTVAKPSDMIGRQMWDTPWYG